MSENTEHPAERSLDEIRWEPQTPQTIEDATISREAISQVARMLGFDPNTVASIHMDAHAVTIRQIIRRDDTGALQRFGSGWSFQEHTRHVQG